MNPSLSLLLLAICQKNGGWAESKAPSRGLRREEITKSNGVINREGIIAAGTSAVLLSIKGNNGEPAEYFPLGPCEGDCDGDDDCEGDLICEHRGETGEISGCAGESEKNNDYCRVVPTGPNPEEMVGPSTSTRSKQPPMDRGKQLVTTFDGQANSAGFMFDMRAINPIIIRSMDINTPLAPNTNARVEIWTREGTHEGFETREEAWTLWMTGTVVARGRDSPTSIPSVVFPPMTVSSGERRAFYIAFSEGSYLRYGRHHEGGGSSNYRNADLILYGNGSAKRKGWDGGVIGPRVFSGALHYDHYTVGVFYYPWHGRDFHRGSRGDGYLRRELRPPQLPVLGEYDDTDPAVIRQHLKWSRAANINLWVLSWWGPGSREDRTIKNVILPHSDLSGTKLALFYETTSRLKKENYTSVNVYPDVEYMANTYFDDPNYMRIDDRPVLFVYLTRVLSEKGTLEEVTNLMRQAAMENGGHDLYIMGDQVFGDAPTNGKEYEPFSLLDGITNYDIYGNLGRPDGYAGLGRLNDLASRNRQWRDETRAHGNCDFVPAVSPGYNDRGVRYARGHTALSRKLYKGAPEGSLFRYSLQKALELREESTGWMIMINSWNEWHEDTQIEHVMVDAGGHTDQPLNMTCYGFECNKSLDYVAYGELYLDILRDATSLHV